MTFTTAPTGYHNETLYDWGKRGLRLHGNPTIRGITGRPRRSFDMRWLADPGRVFPPNSKLIRRLRKITNEVWTVKRKRGRYWVTDHYLAPQQAIDMAMATID